MTIKIEREAVLTAIGASHTPLPPSSYRSTATMPACQHDAAYLPVTPHELIESTMAPSWYAETISHLTRGNKCYLAEDDSIPELDDTDDDCSTISSFSSVVRSRSPARATVTFASVLVTEVRTRPRTRPEDVSALFYSCEETQRYDSCHCISPYTCLNIIFFEFPENDRTNDRGILRTYLTNFIYTFEISAYHFENFCI